jgi:ribonucleotide reductase, class II
MVQELEQIRFRNRSHSESTASQDSSTVANQFPATAPTAYPVFFRTYSRRIGDRRESLDDLIQRTTQGLAKLGNLTAEEVALLERMQKELKSLPSGRWMWVGGTEWIERPENFSGAYNCTSTNLIDWRAFGLMMDLAMMGCGTGAILEPKYVSQLLPIRNRLHVQLGSPIGTTPVGLRREFTEVVPDITPDGNTVRINVGDSRQGWVQSYQAILELSTDDRFRGDIHVIVNLADVRAEGEILKGFGGVANPVKLPVLYGRCAQILNRAIGRQLTPVEACLLIDEAAATVVAGNIRRSAGMRQGSSADAAFASAKENLWQQDEAGNWRIDPERDSLRMANHTRVYHHPPTEQECIDAVRKQFYSGEGAIQYALEAIARANIELLPTLELRHDFLQALSQDQGATWLQVHHPTMPPDEVKHRLGRYGLNPCVTADTWVHTEDGARQVHELIGKQHGTYINGELFSSTPAGFFLSGIKPVVKLQTQQGYALRLTTNHRLLKVTSQTQKAQYTEWVEAGQLQAGDRVLIHNHRGIQPWQGEGTSDEGWLLGNFIGDGCFSVYEPSHSRQGKLRYWGETQSEMYDFALATCQRAFPEFTAKGIYHTQNQYYEVSSAHLFKLAQTYGLQVGNKSITSRIEQTSYAFYQGFLRGFFDADGSVQGTQLKGGSIRLAQSDLPRLEAVQRMLLRVGIASTLYQNRRSAQIRLMPNSQKELAPYDCKAQHELVIANDNLLEFQTVIGFQEPEKAQRLADLLSGYKRKINRERFAVTVMDIFADGEEPVYDCTVPGPSRFDANGFVAHNCGEIIGADFHCNLAEVHLNQIDPLDDVAQADAFKAGALSVAALLNHEFAEPRYQKSRDFDPIVGVSFTGLFDFFVHAFGSEWLRWWEAGRPDSVTGLQFKAQEQAYLQRWRQIVQDTVGEYCDRHGLKTPNRCTTIQPAGTKSLLTGASPGWHPPKAQRFIRRITFRKGDPVAMACLDYGYSVVPSQSDKDETGNLLNDPFDPRCTEWLVEIPVAVSWADIPGADVVEIEKFSALAQFDFYMQVQKFYTAHNTSATLELTEAEIEPLGQRIYQAIANNEGYISAALLARFDAPFPRLPFEKIDQETYDRLQAEVLVRQRNPDFYGALGQYDQGFSLTEGPAGCDSDKCMMPEKKK